MTTMSIRGVSLFVKVVRATGTRWCSCTAARAWITDPVVPAALADDFTLVFYDHRCNGRSE